MFFKKKSNNGNLDMTANAPFSHTQHVMLTQGRHLSQPLQVNICISLMNHAGFVAPENPKRHFKRILPFRKIRKGISSVFCPSGKSGKAFQANFVLPENPKGHFKRILSFRKIRKGISCVFCLFGKSGRAFQTLRSY